MKILPIRGTHDLYGEDLLSYKKIVNIVSNLANIYDFNEIITPIFEDSDLFKKPLGEDSDVVLKEMYSFIDRNKKSITLRPEYTTPMIRASISNNLINKLPLKLFGYGPMFRRERPQKGRFRQFNQINFEILGVDNLSADVELIILANEFLNQVLSSNSFDLYINSLGDRSTILNYKNELKNYFLKNKKDLSIESKNKIQSNPLRILDSKDKNDILICKNSPKIINFYSESAGQQFEDIKSILSSLNINYIIDNNLVRGLDYYCNIVFEFKSKNIGSQNTIIGGGRYDGLVKVLGGPDIPGVGWASGIDRLMLLSKKINKINPLVHIIILDEKFNKYGFNIIKEIRSKNIKASFDHKYNLKKSLSNANINKSKYAIIIGEEEYSKNYLTLKNLDDGEQKEMNLKQIIELLSK